MRKLIVSEFLTLDGVMESPGPDGSSFKFAGWTIAFTNEEIMKFKGQELFASDALLLGRVTYEGFAQAWPTMKGTGEFGEKMNNMPKYVVSDNLKNTTWNNTHIIGAKNIKAELLKLKQKSGKDILVNGSSVVIQNILRLGIIDEFRLLVYPVVVGSGKRLFDSTSKLNLKFIKTNIYKTGVVLLVYRPEYTD